ncbi:MAG TPA: GNAT family N-acetyltransferase [Gemmatimonadales bacterium]|nr:GNAT family N-acetyltransferase [Gemmatimonadales bacterium]
MSAITIRPARPEDVPVILALIEALAEYERLRHECVATTERLHTTLFGDHPAAEVVLAEIDGASVGFALFFHNYSTFLAQRGIWLEDLFVRPEMRGHGIGRALLAHLARLAVTRDCGRLEWYVLDWNAPAIGFYQRLGAVALDDWTIHRLSGAALVALSAQASP